MRGRPCHPLWHEARREQRKNSEVTRVWGGKSAWRCPLPWKCVVLRMKVAMERWKGSPTSKSRHFNLNMNLLLIWYGSGMLGSWDSSYGLPSKVLPLEDASFLLHIDESSKNMHYIYKSQMLTLPWRIDCLLGVPIFYSHTWTGERILWGHGDAPPPSHSEKVWPLWSGWVQYRIGTQSVTKSHVCASFGKFWRENEGSSS